MLQRQEYGLLLSGGGARAAYQVGVLKAITSLLPRNHGVPFPIICGNSAGAINATALACYASCYHLGVRKLEWVWKNFRTEQVYEPGIYGVYSHLFKHYINMFRSKMVQRSPGSLLNNQPLRELIRDMLDFKRIDRNILRKHLHALSVMTSSYSTHDSVSFFQGQPEIEEWQRQLRIGVAGNIDVEHLMASSAIPLVFPTVKIGDEFHGDGSVHLMSPLSTPIRLGAQKILIIGVEKMEKRQQFSDIQHYPASASIAGHLLDTIFADTLNTDLERLDRINATLDAMDEKNRQKTDLKKVECLMINPSENVINIANKHYRQLPRGMRSLLKMIGVNDQSESSLLSYVLFEKEFCQELIELGYQDGLRQQDEIRQFLAI